MLKEIDLVYRTMFAELGQRTLDANFKADFAITGRFVTVTVKGNEYWYFDTPTDSGDKRTYVGPKSDAEISKRVAAFKEIKDDLRARRKLVSTLTRDAGMTSPERFTGDIVEVLADAGLFRLRSVLVGTVAFQTYSGVLGIKLPSAAMQTGDADFAQFHSISTAVGDTIPPVLDVLRQIDPSFRKVPHQSGNLTTQFENAKKYKVEFLTPNTGSDDFASKPASMPALGGAAAEPLRFLDYLIHEPVRTVLLHKSGVSVNVPAPERYAVHKLIVASRRRSDDNGISKRDKDAQQAALLCEALITTRRQSDLAIAYAEAWERGQAWQEGITRGWSFIAERQRADLITGLAKGMGDIGLDPASYGLNIN
ncbi:GSU2403 family nucleotidyltransferase fold protein [Phyllobacterium sp. P30BS-XVII]|uniref:nucleotidyltransferase family protein n=1 Tax=Phyllobacterium sp. P30BS-XVII TaxID=2587046 RepID=UPI0015FB621D|nr:GSU2403 family nucleotidyltransferase fold protein [Phyllobacterium sp. P30BS-XVII]MBA8902073.1 hypothetical protein [Phyllobacterium sp. P30BS-XVII]